jgi:hypothetical protein
MPDFYGDRYPGEASLAEVLEYAVEALEPFWHMDNGLSAMCHEDSLIPEGQITHGMLWQLSTAYAHLKHYAEELKAETR